MSHTPIFALDTARYASEQEVITRAIALADLSPEDRRSISQRAAALVSDIRNTTSPALMEVFLAEYGLSTDEGVALMCLAEALLRVPDAETIDALIEDKIAPSDWGKHLGHSSSSLVNASTWALMLTGRILDDEKPGVSGVLRGAVKRLGEPVIRTAVSRAMKEMGRQFVLGETIEAAMKRAEAQHAKGYTYSYDMLGEAARTRADAEEYYDAYLAAIRAIAKHGEARNVAENPGISVKLSALHPRYEEAKRDTVVAELSERLLSLALEAKAANMGLNVDAEEADRLCLSLDIIEHTLSAPELAGWDGFGIVVQAYGKRATQTIEYLSDLAESLDRKIMIRLVKGAYWDAEIKRSHVEGLADFPVFSEKAATDVNYIANARLLLSHTDRIYPQFATHNAHTVAAILHMAEGMGVARESYEFQRLHGMGETLHDIVHKRENTRCRIYAPVGAHQDLLAYLVRRLLENGANSSFVNQIVDEDIPADVVAACPFDAIGSGTVIPQAADIYAPERENSKGFDLTHRPTFDEMEAARGAFAAPFVWNEGASGTTREIVNPSKTSEIVGYVSEATADTAREAIEAATPWSATVTDRADVLRRAADLYDAQYGEIFALLAREAGKTLNDAVGELREAVDFLRYYAQQAAALAASEPRGIWTCISPWNFPLAIFTGQIAAALATGNAVLAKPAPQTPLIAQLAVRLLHEAGVPASALQLLPGGPEVGAALTSDPRINGVAFTGSTATALKIRAAMAQHCAPGTPLIAETGGLNAMIVDSTALPEHAVRDVLQSAFQSAGQRCSALRCLYVQEDIAGPLIEMLKGGMDCLELGDPWAYRSDSGPLIDEAAFEAISGYVETARREERVLHEIAAPEGGYFLAPTLIAVDGIADMEREVFGPVLHIATFKAHELDKVINDINASGYGLTFGLHTRIDDRVQHIIERVHAGNIYVNRNQIGAVVGSQPFGGEGLSGTGPKAGGPLYLPRFAAPERAGEAGEWTENASLITLPDTPEAAIATTDMPGPTGESNRHSTYPRGPVLCLGPGRDCAEAQAASVRAQGGIAVVPDGRVSPEALVKLDIAAALWWGEEAQARAYEAALAQRVGPIVPLITSMPDAAHVLHERHVCIDTTASGGNTALLASVGS